MDKFELVNELTKLQILTERWVSRHKGLESVTFRDLDRIIMGSKVCCTYLYASKQLKKTILAYASECTFLRERAEKLEEEMAKSEIKDIRFGVCPEKDLCYELELYKMKRLMSFTSMVSLKVAEDMLGINASSLKRYCQEEKLLNTKKIGKTWTVNIAECVDKLNVPEENKLKIKNKESLIY